MAVDPRLAHGEFEIRIERDDEATYTRERDLLREEILLTEMDLADAQVEQIDVEGILASAEDIISNASALWKEGTLDQRERLQRLLFPEG